MKKLSLLCIILCVLSISLYSQSSLNSNNLNRQSFYLTSGVHVINGGIANTHFANIGAEYSVNNNFSLFYNLSIWKILDMYIGSTLGFKIHIDNRTFFDPYAGLGVESFSVINSETRILDVPAILGLNINFTENFGLKIEYKQYLLSLIVHDIMFSELNAGIRITI